MCARPTSECQLLLYYFILISSKTAHIWDPCYLYLLEEPTRTASKFTQNWPLAFHQSPSALGLCFFFFLFGRESNHILYNNSTLLLLFLIELLHVEFILFSWEYVPIWDIGFLIRFVSYFSKVVFFSTYYLLSNALFCLSVCLEWCSYVRVKVYRETIDL